MKGIELRIGNRNMTTAAEYCHNNILVIPQALFGMSDLTRVMRAEDSVIFCKDLEQDLTDVEFYTNIPCLVYIERGREQITTSDNDQLDLREGEALFLSQGLNLHSDYVQTYGNLKAWLVFLDPALVTDFLLSVDAVGVASPKQTELLKLPASEALALFFKSVEYHAEHSVSEGLARLKMMELLHLLLQQAGQQLISLLQTGKVAASPKRNLQRLLQQPESLKLSLADLAALSGRSLSSFNRDFRSVYGSAPGRWLKERRMHHARELIERRGHSVTEAAVEVGYENISHFIAAFRACHGLTPGQCRVLSLS